MDDLTLLTDAALKSGEIGLKYFKKDPEKWTKGGGSPVSEADLAIDKYLKETLLAARPDYGWLSEETEDNLARLEKDKVFVVDPIDGTRGFLEETENWMISIAVVNKGATESAALFGPVMDRLYVSQKGEGASCNGESLLISSEQIGLYGQYAMPASIVSDLKETTTGDISKARYVHSLAYRLALVADGEFAGAIARPKAKDWDLAAADLILQEAGGEILNLKGESPRYNREETSHDWIIAAGKTSSHLLKDAVLTAIENDSSK